MHKKPQLSIILPVKQEQENILWTLDAIANTVTYSYEILVICDTMRDPTIQVLKNNKKHTASVRICVNTFGHGVLQAINTGLRKARGDVLVVMAADRTDDPATINAMYKKILSGCDIVCPTRYANGGSAIGPISLKSVLSRLAGLSTPYLLGIPTSDLTYSFKMFTKKLMNAITIQSRNGFEFSEEMVIKSHVKGYTIGEVPTVWRDRQYGRSKFRLFHWLPHYMYWYVWGMLQRLTV